MDKQGTDAFVADSTAIQTHAWQSLRDHFGGIPAVELSSSIRTYPDYMRPDIQAALSARVVDFQNQLLGINQLHEGFSRLRKYLTPKSPKRSVQTLLVKTPQL
jgi:hypothetical protein